MSESNEPSYYEIALTNRQVLVSFVVLLSCVMAAFVSGVWVGRKGLSLAGTDGGQLAAAEAVPSDLEGLEELRFPSDPRPAGAPAGDDDPRQPAAEPRSGTTLAEDVGSAPPPRAAPPPPRAAPPPPRAAPPPPAVVASPATPAEGFVIQVLSTREEAKANRILTQLSQGGYPAFLSPVEVGSQVQYRVRIGPYAERAAAEKAGQEVNRKYKLDTWITAASN